MRHRIVAGNWKMHGSKAFAVDYVQALARARSEGDFGAVQVILFPPGVYLGLVAEEIANRGLSDVVTIGAQDLHTESTGAYTGEIAAEMIADLGARWVLVGHSERREYAAESDDLVARKFEAALRGGLGPMLCVGETQAEREADQAEAVVSRQLGAVAERVGIDGLMLGALAYEPVWAIGTGKTATPDIAQAMHAVLRRELAALSASLAEQMPLLYGGSVKPDNAVELFGQLDIDGGLVGGASLEAGGFADIIRAGAGPG